MTTMNATAMAAALAALVLAMPAGATEINFDGSVDNTCTIKGKKDGTLGLSGDGRTLSSELGSAVAGEVDVFATGANRLIFSAPTLTQQPAGYSGSPTLEIKVGSGSFSSAEQEQPVAYPGTTLAVNARASDDVPFLAGDYRVTTVVSCVPVTDGAPTS